MSPGATIISTRIPRVIGVAESGVPVIGVPLVATKRKEYSSEEIIPTVWDRLCYILRLPVIESEPSTFKLFLVYSLAVVVDLLAVVVSVVPTIVVVVTIEPEQVILIAAIWMPPECLLKWKKKCVRVLS